MDWDSPEISSIIDRALEEDLGKGDVTSRVLIPEDRKGKAVFVAKERGILAGFPLIPRIFLRLDSSIRMEAFVAEGSKLKKGSEIAELEGSAIALLAGERLALNFLQRLSGIATQTARFAALAAPFGIAVLDTRKTTPLLRTLEKYAVRTGGGKNHRAGLYDAVLVKDNHLCIRPDFKTVLDAFRAQGYPPERVEIEVTDPAMLQKAIRAGGRYFLLDNMPAANIRKCIKLKKAGMFFEVSGGINTRSFPKYLIRGIDAISIGALTHSVKSLDISLEFHV
jgi:nicotinate-nucleotide pyrophosphorylase (carboxylating)